MRANVMLSNAVFPMGTWFRVALGEAFEIALFNTMGRIRWSADNDEVLEIDDDSGPKAGFKATAVGRSRLEIKGRSSRLVVYIDVYAEPTVTVGMTFGNVRDR